MTDDVRRPGGDRRLPAAAALAACLLFSELAAPTPAHAGSSPPGGDAPAADVAAAPGPDPVAEAETAAEHRAADDRARRLSAAPRVTVFAAADDELPLAVHHGDDLAPDPTAGKVVVEGTLHPAATGDHEIGLGPDGALEVDGVPRADGRAALTAGQPVEIRLTATSPGDSVPWWLSPGEEARTPLPVTSLTAPASDTAGAREGGPTRATEGRRSVCGTPSPTDSDADGVPDAWEVGGYTVAGTTLTAWSTELGERGHRRWVSDPLRCRSAHDPYTDREKALGLMPAASAPEARDPLVAAAPAVGVGLEEFSVTPKYTWSDSVGTTFSFSSTQSTTLSFGGGAGVEAGKDSQGPSGKVSLDFTVSNSRTHSITEGSSTTWQQAVSYMNHDTASVNGAVRYRNAGTAPVYLAQPTTNWLIDDRSFATFRVGPSHLANALGAGEAYPAPGLDPLSVETVNDMATADLSITTDEMDRLRRSSEIEVQTPQTAGRFGVVTEGRPVAPAGEWDPYLADIRATGALLMLDGDGETAERWVATPDPSDPDSRTPTLTIGEALDRAFDLEQRDGRRWYSSSSRGEPSFSEPVLIDEAALMTNVDEVTDRLLAEQRTARPGASLFDLELRRGMRIALVPATSFQGFDDGDHSGWSAHAPADGFVEPASRGTTARRDLPGLTPGHRYAVRFATGHSRHGDATSVWLHASDGTMLDRSERPPSSAWARAYLEFTAADSAAYFLGRLKFDDVAVFDLGAVRMADTTWNTRSGADLPVVGTPGDLEVPRDWKDALGLARLDLVLSRDGRRIDLRSGKVAVSSGALRAWSTEHPWKEQGYVNLPLAGEDGAATVTTYTPRQASTTGCDTCFDPISIVRVTVRAPRPATVAFHGSGGERDVLCTVRLSALEEPGYRGEFSQTLDMKHIFSTCPNDDIYSVRFENLPLGTDLQVFDDPKGGRGDDFVHWETTVPSGPRVALDPTATTVPGVRVLTKYYKNGLMGKVSRATVQYPGEVRQVPRP